MPIEQAVRMFFLSDCRNESRKSYANGHRPVLIFRNASSVMKSLECDDAVSTQEQSHAQRSLVVRIQTVTRVLYPRLHELQPHKTKNSLIIPL